MKNEPKICVIGSINMDLVTKTTKMPEKGETIEGEGFESFPGGKGANQAIAASRLGANVSMVGAVGNDTFGNKLLNVFKSEKVDLSRIKVLQGIPTGIATIILSDNDNRIIISSGANSKLTPAIVEESLDVILASDIILLQFEIPMETIRYIVDFAFEHKIPVILNPAPFKAIDNDILQKVTYLTPNEIEFSNLNQASAIDAYKDKMIITKGSDGVEFLAGSSEFRTIPAYKANVKDTTGAGDTFNGALTTELARGQELDKAIEFANAAAALSVEKLGAQAGMPFRQDVLNFMERTKN